MESPVALLNGTKAKQINLIWHLFDLSDYGV